MRNRIRDFFYRTALGYVLIFPLLQLRKFIVGRNNLLKLRFKRRLGYPLSLQNPRTFNEKLQWIKLNDRRDLYVTGADKLLVRDYIAEQIGEQYLIPLIWSGDSMNNFDPSILPDYPVVLKANHNSGGVLIIKDKTEVDWPKVIKEFNRALTFDESILDKDEWHYTQIKPRLLIEKMLVEDNGESPSDYKLHCFNGKVVYTQVDQDRFTAHKRNLYDRDWNLIPVKWHRPNGPETPKPSLYKEMVILAEQLAVPFPFIRVDFYQHREQIYFGELTFFPMSGFQKFEPESYDLYFGEMLELPTQT